MKKGVGGGATGGFKRFHRKCLTFAHLRIQFKTATGRRLAGTGVRLLSRCNLWSQRGVPKIV